MKSYFQLACTSSALVLLTSLANADQRCVELHPQNNAKTQTKNAILVSDFGLFQHGCQAKVSNVKAQVKETQPVAEPVVETRTELPEKKQLASHSINFELNSSEITTESKELLKSIAQQISVTGAKNVKLIGLADKTGQSQSNLVLSNKRAQAVKKIMADLGVDSSVLKVEALGSKPENASRRVDIQIQ